MADNGVCQGFESRSISLPAKVWSLLERVKKDRQDPTLSDTIRVLLLQQLAEKRKLWECPHDFHGLRPLWCLNLTHPELVHRGLSLMNDWCDRTGERPDA